MSDPAADAATLVAMNVADMSASLEGIDLATLKLAFDAETAKGDAARKGALAALQSAIDGHPEMAAEAAAQADSPLAETKAPEAQPMPATGEVNVEIGAQVSDVVITEATEDAPATASVTIQPTVDGEPNGDPITTTVTADTPLDGTIETIAEPVPAGDELEDEPAPADALSSAPARPHQSLVDQLEMRWNELLDFIRYLEGEVEGDLGEVLTFARSKL